jgi:hypothetical protein
LQLIGSALLVQHRVSGRDRRKTGCAMGPLRPGTALCPA